MTAIIDSPKQRAWAWSLTNEQLAARLLDPHHSYTPQDTAALMAEAANRQLRPARWCADRP
jgi:hypothetical protein